MFLRGNATDWQTRIRLWAAIIMAMYAINYAVYYALGLISIESMEIYQDIAHLVTPLFLVIPVVILIHVSLGLWKLFKRNTLKIPLWEMSQIFFGISIPFFLLPHIIYTYGMFLFFGMKENYVDELLMTFPIFAWQYVLMTLVIWIHAQIGIHVVFRMRKWYPKIRLIIIIIFISMPALGIGGYFKAGLELKNKISGNNTGYYIEEIHSPDANQLQLMKNLAYSVYIIFPLLYLSVLFSRAVRIKIKNKNKNVILGYSNGKTVNVFPKTTILEASRIGNIPHASICGGRGRCTTCRVKVDKGNDNLSPVGEREQRALKKISAENEVRLACQAECRKEEIFVTLLLPPDIKSISARKENKYSVGSEMNLAVMFADLRGFTRLSEEKFPYDVVFILNRYFNNMGEVIEKNGGTIDKFLGDGILAYFGFDEKPEIACTRALTASKQMAEKLTEINDQLKNALKSPLEIGIGIHFGEVILGDIGYKEKTAFTIIGDTVNTASRLESLNKKAASQLIFSSIVAKTANIDFPEIKKHNALIRGKKNPMEVYIIKDIVNELKLDTLM